MTTTLSPTANGPLLKVHRDAGATLQVVGGWQVATRYPSEPAMGANAIVDISHMPTQEIAGPETGETLQTSCGHEVPVRAIHITDNWQAYRLTDVRAIVFGRGSLPDAIDVTGGWTSIALFGPVARMVLNKITALDIRDCTLPVRHCCQGPIFGVNTLLGRFENRYELHVCPDSLEFLWKVILDAGREFNLKPAGLEYYRHSVRSTDSS